MGEPELKFLEECRDIKTPKEMEDYVFPVGAERFYPDPERIFHDTVPLPEEQLPEVREKASVQKDAILKYFKDNYPCNFTPAEVWERLQIPLLLTSVRRSICDLTKEGRLIKCQRSERREGAYGILNRVWRYCDDFIKPINPQQ